MSVDVFNNPFNGSPTVWNAQGALITWATVNPNLANSTQAIMSGLAADLSSGQPRGNNKDSHVFACLTGITVQYQRQSSTQYPIGGHNPVRILGAPQGSCQITSLLGPTSDIQQFLRDAASDCNSQIIIGIKPFSTQNCETAAGTQQPIIMLQGCSVNALNIQIQSQGAGISVVNVPINLQFTQLTWNF